MESAVCWLLTELSFPLTMVSAVTWFFVLRQQRWKNTIFMTSEQSDYRQRIHLHRVYSLRMRLPSSCFSAI